MKIHLAKEELLLARKIGLFLLIVLAAWLLLIAPRQRALAKIRDKVRQDAALLSEIKAMIGTETGLEEGIAIMQQQSKKLWSQFIDQKDIFLALNRITEAADVAGVKIISTTPQSLSVFTNKRNTVPRYAERTCLKQPVRITLEGTYEQLANYLYLLEDSPVGIFSVDGFFISKVKDIAPDLRMDLTLGLYVFGEERTVIK